MLPLKFNTRGVISPLILIGVVAVLVLFVVLSSLPIKDKLLGGLFPKSASQAAGIVDLSLVPNAVSVAKDQTFLMDIAIDAKTERVTATNLEISFNPQVLQAQELEPGFFLPVLLGPLLLDGSGNPILDNNGAVQLDKAAAIDNTNGKIVITLGSLPNATKTGNGILATLKFKALTTSSPTTPVQFTANTHAAVLLKTGDQIGNLNNSTVTVTATPVVNKVAQFSLSGVPSSITAGNTFNMAVRAMTPDAANLFAARLNFNSALLDVVSIDTNSSFVTPAQWVNNNFDNTNGLINLIGGVPTPGFTSASPTTMATVTFRAKSAGTAQINFGANSAIYRNVDNVDILQTPVTGASVNITGVAPSPSPSVAPSPSPSVAPSPSPSAAASASPSPAASPSPSAAASASPSPSAAASPSPSASPLACTITGASWVTSANPINQGKVVSLSVTGSTGCAGQSVSFTVWEDDGVAGSDATVNAPPTTKFNSNNQATSSWIAEFQDDMNGLSNPPEYFFLAQVTGGTPFKSADPLLQVNKVSGGTFLSGDFNHDGVVDLVDLSILLSNWNKTTNFLDELDLNTDGAVNSVDWSTLLQILRVGGIIQ